MITAERIEGATRAYHEAWREEWVKLGSPAPTLPAWEELPHSAKEATASCLNAALSALEPSPATVTEGMVERACEAAGWIAEASEPRTEGGAIVDPGLSLEDAVEISGQLRDAMRDILKATLSQSPTHRHKKTGTEYVLMGFSVMRAANWQVSIDGFDAPMSGRPVATLHSTEGSITVPREEFEAEYEEIAR